MLRSYTCCHLSWWYQTNIVWATSCTEQCSAPTAGRSLVEIGDTPFTSAVDDGDSFSSISSDYAAAHFMNYTVNAGDAANIPSLIVAARLEAKVEFGSNAVNQTALPFSLEELLRDGLVYRAKERRH
jgi:hypothetical protein